MAATLLRAERAARPSADATREALLDSAERLFGEHGYPGVTIRQIAAEARVDPALANYHFGGKKGLLDAALLRRAEGFMVERVDAMERCIADAGGEPSLRDIILAYTRPYLARFETGGSGWRSWFKLLAQVNNNPEWAPEVFRDAFDPFVRKFIEAMRLAAPGAPDVQYYWCYHFFAGALVLTFADTGRVTHLSNGVCQSGDLASGYDLLIEFVTRGCETILHGATPGGADHHEQPTAATGEARRPTGRGNP